MTKYVYYNNILHIYYKTSNDSIDGIVNISGDEDNISNLDNIQNVKKIQWSPDFEHKNKTFEFDISGAKNKNIRIFDIPDDKNNLYNNGNYDDLWIEGHTTNLENTIGYMQKNEDNLEIFATDGGNDTRGRGTWVTKKLIDFEPYNNLIVEWENTGSSQENQNDSYVKIFDEPNSVWSADEDTLYNRKGSFNKRKDTIDVSDINEKYYIAIAGYESTSGEEPSHLFMYDMTFET